MFILRFLPFILLISFPALAAKTTTANVSVKASVVIPTCTVNSKSELEGLTQNIDMGHYTKNEIEQGDRNIMIPIKVKCAEEGIGIRGILLDLTALPQFPAVTDQVGAIQTSLNGVSVQMQWKDGSPVHIGGQKKEFRNVHNNSWDASIISTLRIRPGFNIDSIQTGALKSAVNIHLSYY